ncbi:3-oxoadipate enol-lactonase [Frigidibacter sp. SD6-1]|uniref:3-oxoadipate enol-lactonase n=1 Tax=Frigidibacter sp. SD6-1 TaxID=3032581 RepID=UPI0024DF3605|nr:3-oxoadipate enol-lactonase [Frigidibacter sp. SD6-1]
MSEPHLHWQEGGDPKGAPVVFAHALGLDLRLWDKVLPLLPPGLRLIRLDLRGHGQSDVPPAPYAMGALIRDVEALLDRLAVRDCAFVGLSVGGLIAQGLAVKRLDMVRALVLSNTAAKIGTRAIWEGRIDAVRSGGIAAIADATLERWFPKPLRDGPEGRLWRERLLSTPVEGYIGVAAAIGGTDFITPTSGLRLPALVLAGDRDGSTPPDLVRELAGLIPDSDFRILRGAGHLPPVDKPEAFAAALGDFLIRTGHPGS